jgi:hypothetical protein
MTRSIITETDMTAGRMDTDTLFSVARTLDCLALQVAPEQRARILEDALLRRAREIQELARPHPDLREPLTLRTIWRAGYEPRLVHWCVGGIAEAGGCGVFDDLEFAACGAEVSGCYVGEEATWGRGTMHEHPVTCPKCLELFRSAERS